jgi:hypothetical protein
MQHLRLHAFSDASIGTDPDARARTGSILRLGDDSHSVPINVSAHLQHRVANSSTAAELIAIARTCQSVSHYRNVLEWMGHAQAPTLIMTDSEPALKDITNRHLSNRTRYLNIDFQFILDFIQRGEIRIAWESTHTLLADVLTKPLPATKFFPFIDKLFGIPPVSMQQTTDPYKRIKQQKQTRRSSKS